MALEDILNRISSNARRKSNKLEREAKNQAREILADAKRKATLTRKRMLKAADEAAEQERKRIIALANLKARNIVLEQKQKALGRAFDTALDKLLTLPEEKYLNVIRRMLLSTVTSGDEEVIVCSSDKKRVGKLLEEVNSDLAASGKKGNLKLSEEERKEIRGGFILKSGKIEENNSFSSLLDTLKDELESQLFKILLSPAGQEFKSKGA